MYIFTSSTIDEVRSTVASWFTAANYNVDQDLIAWETPPHTYRLPRCHSTSTPESALSFAGTLAWNILQPTLSDITPTRSSSAHYIYMFLFADN